MGTAWKGGGIVHRSSLLVQISSSPLILLRGEERQGGRGGRHWSNDRGENERRDRTAVIRRKKESTRWIGAISDILIIAPSKNHSFPSVKAQAERRWRFKMRTTWNFSPTETSCPPSWAELRGDEMEGGN